MEHLVPGRVLSVQLGGDTVKDLQCPWRGSWRTGRTVGPEVHVSRPMLSDLKEETDEGQIRLVLVEERKLLMVSVQQEGLVSSFIHGIVIEGSGLTSVCPELCVSFSVQPQILGLFSHPCPCLLVSSLACPHSV